MFSFFRKSQDAKKNAIQERETDGFVVLGQTTNEQRNNILELPGTTFTYNQPFQTPQQEALHFNRDGSGATKVTSPASEGNLVMAELLNDIPFILAPHVLEVQNICRELPERVQLYNLDENFARFHYDFTLENSVLCGL
ncbi:hypothetical protein FKM82_026974 [Ascaphus truei]|uniref:UBAP1-MVB12-associated (UMA)-domain containing protein 1 isoform X2 n=1 Tax=Ascaphus truei TaxID=8439 RepID=UPI003F59B02B